MDLYMENIVVKFRRWLHVMIYSRKKNYPDHMGIVSLILLGSKTSDIK